MKAQVSLLIVICTMLVSESIAQDMHFSQVMNFPMLVNPALTGKYNAQSRATLSVRNQNVTVPNTAFSGVYNTVAASAETILFPEMTDQNEWSIGIYGTSDYAGSGTLATNQVAISSAYTVAMDRYGQSFLTVGGQVGGTARRLFSNDLLFESQVSGFEFDPSLPNLEPFLDGSTHTVFNLNIGTMYQQQLGESALMQLGGSIYNINTPNELFMNGSEQYIYSRLNLHSSFSFMLDDYSSLTPSAIFMKQGNFSQINAGIGYTRELNEDMDILAGIRLRANDAFIFIAGMKFRRLSTTFSYDFTTSNLKRANNSVGAFEFNINYLFGEEKDTYNSSKQYCPTF